MATVKGLVVNEIRGKRRRMEKHFEQCKNHKAASHLTLKRQGDIKIYRDLNIGIWINLT